MPLIPCPNSIKECLPCLDDPIRNISAEDPDVDRFIGVNNFFLTDVPLNHSFRQSACKKFCYSEVSQDEADDCARLAAQECVYDDVFPGGSDGTTPISQFRNTTQSFTVECPDGTEFTWTIASGQFMALSQATANAIARSVAKNRAIQNRICILSSNLDGGCANSSFSVTIQAVGGTSLFFPYILGPQTPIGFSGCSLNFHPVRYVWTLVSGSLPPGMELDECTGIISGTPTSSGSYTFTVRATDAIGSFQQKTLRICIIEITTASELPAGNAGTPYVKNLTETPGQQETELWTLVDGVLPDGLTLSEAGVLSGTPTEIGSHGFRIRVRVGSC